MIEKHAQKLNTYSLENWETVIKTSLTKADDKRVVKMNLVKYSDIANFKPKEHDKLGMYEHLFKECKDNNGQIVKWSKIIQAKFVKTDHTKMFIKYEYSSPNYSEVQFVQFRRKSGRLINETASFPMHSDLPKLYEKPPGILKKKYDDLNKLCDKMPPLIPPNHQQFYRNLIVKGDDKDSDED